MFESELVQQISENRNAVAQSGPFARANMNGRRRGDHRSTMSSNPHLTQGGPAPAPTTTRRPSLHTRIIHSKPHELAGVLIDAAENNKRELNKLIRQGHYFKLDGQNLRPYAKKLHLLPWQVTQAPGADATGGKFDGADMRNANVEAMTVAGGSINGAKAGGLRANRIKANRASMKSNFGGGQFAEAQISNSNVSNAKFDVEGRGMSLNNVHGHDTVVDIKGPYSMSGTLDSASIKRADPGTDLTGTTLINPVNVQGINALAPDKRPTFKHSSMMASLMNGASRPTMAGTMRRLMVEAVPTLGML